MKFMKAVWQFCRFMFGRDGNKTGGVKYAPFSKLALRREWIVAMRVSLTNTTIFSVDEKF